MPGRFGFESLDVGEDMLSAVYSGYRERLPGRIDRVEFHPGEAAERTTEEWSSATRRTIEWSRESDSMRAALAQTASIAIIIFAVSSMLSVGLAYRIGLIVGPLLEARAVFRALVANFVLVPLLAVGIERAIPMDPPLALGLFLLAGSAGAPFLIKLTAAARSDLALSAALLMLPVPVTVVFLPFYLPLALAHPSLRGLSYVPSSILAIGLPLLSTLILPILLGLAVKAVARVGPPGSSRSEARWRLSRSWW